jgi:hypothetical protein
MFASFETHEAHSVKLNFLYYFILYSVVHDPKWHHPAIHRAQKIVFTFFRFCYVIFNSHMFNAPRFNSEKDVSLKFFFT